MRRRSRRDSRSLPSSRKRSIDVYSEHRSYLARDLSHALSLYTPLARRRVKPNRPVQFFPVRQPRLVVSRRALAVMPHNSKLEAVKCVKSTLKKYSQRRTGRGSGRRARVRVFQAARRSC